MIQINKVGRTKGTQKANSHTLAILCLTNIEHFTKLEIFFKQRFVRFGVKLESVEVEV